MTIAERLIQARGNRPREQVAKAVGVSISAIGMYETGARVPRDEVKVKLADYYGITVQELFLIRLVTYRDLVQVKGGEGEMRPEEQDRLELLEKAGKEGQNSIQMFNKQREKCADQSAEKRIKKLERPGVKSCVSEIRQSQEEVR